MTPNKEGQFMKYLKALFISFTISFSGLSIKAQQTNSLLNQDCLTNIDCVQQALANGVDVNATNSDGRTPLHIVLTIEEANIAQTLLDAGADVDARTRNGQTPLHIASERGETNIVQALIDAGADVNAKTKDGKTPLQLAIDKEQVAIIRPLLNHNAIAPKTGTDLYSKMIELLKSENGRTPLQLASIAGEEFVTQFLLEIGLDANATNDSWTPLTDAILLGHVPIIRLLLDHEAVAPKAGTQLHAKMTRLLETNTQ